MAAFSIPGKWRGRGHALFMPDTALSCGRARAKRDTLFLAGKRLPQGRSVHFLEHFVKEAPGI